MTNPAKMHKSPQGQTNVGKVQVIHGRETIARCQKCGAESWHIIGEVRREEFDKPDVVQAQAMRMVCTNCHVWMYISDVIKPHVPHVAHRTFIPKPSRGN